MMHFTSLAGVGLAHSHLPVPARHLRRGHHPLRCCCAQEPAASGIIKGDCHSGAGERGAGLLILIFHLARPGPSGS